MASIDWLGSGDRLFNVAEILADDRWVDRDWFDCQRIFARDAGVLLHVCELGWASVVCRIRIASRNLKFRKS